MVLYKIHRINNLFLLRKEKKKQLLTSKFCYFKFIAQRIFFLSTKINNRTFAKVQLSFTTEGEYWQGSWFTSTELVEFNFHTFGNEHTYCPPGLDTRTVEWFRQASITYTNLVSPFYK